MSGDPVYQDSSCHSGETSVTVGNPKRHARASIYTAVGPFIKLDVLEQSRSADEEGAVYLWPEEAHSLGEWLIATAREIGRVGPR